RHLLECIFDDLALAQELEGPRLSPREAEEARLRVGGGEPVDRPGEARGRAPHPLQASLVPRWARPPPAAVHADAELVRGAGERGFVRGLREAQPSALLARLVPLDREDGAVPRLRAAPALVTQSILDLSALAGCFLDDARLRPPLRDRPGAGIVVANR